MHARFPASLRPFMAAAIAACLLSVTLPARAENLVIFRSADQQRLEPSHPQAVSGKQARLALDDDGNVMVRFNRMSVTFIYDAGGSPQENRMRPNVPHQEVACLGGLSVKLGVSF